MENYKLLLIKTDGHIQCIDSPKIPKLETLQQLIDGFIEVMYCKRRYIFLVNDEGAINASRYNAVASILQAEGIYGPTCSIFGDVVVAIDDDEDIRAMTEDEYNAFLDWSADVCMSVYCDKAEMLAEIESDT